MSLSQPTPETGPDAVASSIAEAAHARLSEDKRAARRRWTIAIGLSVVINLLLIAAIILTLPPLPVVVPDPIPVHVVPPDVLKQKPPVPPAPKPKPQEQAQQKKQTPKPPPGRLASEELGDPKAPETAKLMSRTKASGTINPDEGSEQPTTKGDASASDAPKPSPDKEMGSKKPKPVKELKPAEKKGGSRVQALMGDPHNGQHHAKYPGPDATKDAYLAYINDLVKQCETPEILSQLAIVGKIPLISISVRHNGVILWVNVIRSSGSATFDEQYKTIFDCVGRFPPLPDYIPGATVNLTYGDSRDTPP
jgi:TonB C terminal